MGVGAALNFIGAAYASFALSETRPASEKKAVPLMPAEQQENTGTALSSSGELYAANALLGVNRLAVAGVIPATFGLFLAQQLGDPISSGAGTLGVATLAGLGLGMGTLISTGVVPIIGRLSDRARTRWLVVSAGLFFGVLGFSLMGLGIPWSIFMGLIFIAVTSASNTSLSTTLVGDLSGVDRQSRRLGMLYTVGDLGSAIGPPLAFGMLPLLGLKGLYYLLAGVLVMMLALALWWSKKKLQGRPAFK
jgi:MFS family permease